MMDVMPTIVVESGSPPGSVEDVERSVYCNGGVLETVTLPIANGVTSVGDSDSEEVSNDISLLATPLREYKASLGIDWHRSHL